MELTFDPTGNSTGGSAIEMPNFSDLYDTNTIPPNKDSTVITIHRPIDTEQPRRPAAVEPREPDSPPGRQPVARCADGNGTMTGLFFSDNIIDIGRAKAMCGLCGLRETCLAGALEREEPWGVWGGELLSGGRVIANKRACGRPPTRPRPEMVIDELGPVPVVA